MSDEFNYDVFGTDSEPAPIPVKKPKKEEDTFEYDVFDAAPSEPVSAEPETEIAEDTLATEIESAAEANADAYPTEFDTSTESSQSQYYSTDDSGYSGDTSALPETNQKSFKAGPAGAVAAGLALGGNILNKNRKNNTKQKKPRVNKRKNKNSNGYDSFDKVKKPLYKRWWFWLLIIVLICCIKSCVSSDSKDNNEITTSTTIATTTVSETEAVTEAPTESGEVTYTFKETMDSYEAFFDEYVNFMNRYNNSDGTDLQLLSDLGTYMQKYSEYMDKLSNMNTDDLSPADLAYYYEVQGRVMQKLSQVTG